MDFDHTPEEIDFRRRVRRTLSEMDTARPFADERPLYRLLGAAGLLGVDWPVEYGGRGLSAAHLSIVSEEIVRAGIPDTLFVNGILTVGRLVLNVGTSEQKSRLLPGLARGEKFAGVLYTEPEAGSDLTALTTTATRHGDQFRLTGTKVFGLKSDRTDLGLCLARTPSTDQRGKYGDLTLFLIDMRAPGVHVTPLEGLPEEVFHVVVLDEVGVSPEDIVGGLGNGSSVLFQALPLERIGFDFSMRAERWYELALQAVHPSADDSVEAARYAAKVAAARLLSWKASTKTDAVHTSVAKWYASELAADVARWAVLRHPPDLPPEIAMIHREAPALTLAGGTSEMMLQTLAEQLPDAVDRVG